MLRISEIISKTCVIPDLVATDKSSVLEELAGSMASQVEAIEAEPLYKVLVEREALSSTAIGHGVAIPHGKLSQVKSLVACLGRSIKGVDFDSIDGERSFLFILLVAPHNSTGEHLKALARISRLFRKPDFREQLMNSNTAEEMHSAIVRYEVQC